MSTLPPHLDYDGFVKAAPAAHAALLALGKTVDESGLEKSLIEIVKLRVSQINGCAFCVQIHINIARKIGVPQEKLDLVAVWRDAGIFSDREMAALTWAEMLTNVSHKPISDAAYSALLPHFSATEILFLAVAIGTINHWNRLGTAFHFAPPILKKPAATDAT